MVKLTNEMFFKRVHIIHNGKYTYNDDFNGVKKKIKITCPIHGEFNMLASNHIYGKQGCVKCNNPKLSYEAFIKKSKYKVVEYNGLNNNCILKCSIHGNFKIDSKNYLYNSRECPNCVKDKAYGIKEFIEAGSNIHNNYDYSKVNYVNMQTPVIIICPHHGEFLQKPFDHIQNKSGCLKCHESRGERKIRIFLEKYNIIFEKEKIIFDNKRFDFYLPDYNICIEYDGIQHFEEVEFFGGKEFLQKQQLSDLKKDQYCDQNNIHLIRIKYTDDLDRILFMKLKDLNLQLT